MARTIGKNNKITHQIFSTKTDVYAHLRGPIAEPAFAVKFSAKKICDVFDRIVRGLYWMEKHTALGLAPEIRIFPFHAMDSAFHCSMKELMDCLEPKVLHLRTQQLHQQNVSESTSYPRLKPSPAQARSG